MVRVFELITFSDDNYPENLKHIHSAPPVLYVFGEIKKQDILSIAVVGSRFSNKYGNDTAHNFSSELAAMGVCIVSGMARGVDSTAHKAAIDAGGRTIAILGSGLDVIYPPENHELYEKIAKNGAVVSTFPLGTGPGKTNFPERNTFISGLSLGTVVVQAAGKSGALLTAYLALEQNRHVFAVPGRVGDKMSAGTNFLIKESLAKLVENTDDIVNEISDFQKLRSGREEEKSAESRGKKLASLPKAKRRLLSLITEKPLHIDEISEKSGEAVSSISTQMLELEIEGLAQQIEGGLYQAEI